MKLNKILNVISVFGIAGTVYAGIWYVNKTKENVDLEPPRIQFEQDVIHCSISADIAELKAGVTATDNVDGDLTEKIMISGIQIKKEDFTTEKEFEITYVVFDSSNNMTAESRTLFYDDYHSPRFVLREPMLFESPWDVKPLDFLQVEDCIDGNIGGQIALDIEECNGYGTYDFTARVTNSLGDSAELPLTFRVIDFGSDEEQMKPDIILTDYIIYLDQGEHFEPSDYLEKIWIDRKAYKLLSADQVTITEDTTSTGFGYSNNRWGAFMLKDMITITSDVDTDIPGVYYVRYSFHHPVEGTNGSSELMVVVE